MDARKVAGILALVLLTGCAAPAPEVIRVPYAIPCQQSVPGRPAMPTDSLIPPVTVDAWIASAQSELDVREGYEIDLMARLLACTATKGIVR